MVFIEFWLNLQFCSHEMICLTQHVPIKKKKTPNLKLSRLKRKLFHCDVQPVLYSTQKACLWTHFILGIAGLDFNSCLPV